MFYTILFLIIWAVGSFPTLSAFNGPLIGLLIAIVADVFFNRGILLHR